MLGQSYLMRLEFLVKKLVATLSLKIHFSIECRKIKYPFIFYVLYIRADFLSFGINFNRGALYHGESETGLSDRDKRDASVEEDSASQTSAACILTIERFVLVIFFRRFFAATKKKHPNLEMWNERYRNASPIARRTTTTTNFCTTRRCS